MNPHPYLRAYMAGVAVPTVFLLAVFAGFCVVRFGYNPEFPIERVLVFPLALAPAIWGGWNMVYVALRGRRWVSLGIHGALVPLALMPLALAASKALGFEFIVNAGGVVLIAAPLVMILYYLLWKYVVGWLNEVLEIA